MSANFRRQGNERVYSASRAANFAAFDKLSKEERDFMNYFPVSVSPKQLASIPKGKRMQALTNTVEKLCPDWRPLKRDPAIMHRLAPIDLELD